MQTKFSHKLGQRLALTPQLTQSLKVLSMNAMELDTYLEECLESNPMLEQDQNASADIPAVQELAASGTANEEWRESGDNRWETMYTPSSREHMPDMDQQWQNEQCLSDALHEQINQQPMSDTERLIAQALIDSLEDDGYFRADPSELASNLKVTAAEVADVLEQIVHELEPAGIGARHLIECLLLQLDGQNEADALVRRLLLHFSEDLFEPDDVLAARAGCTAEALVQAHARIRRLDPFPGHGMHGGENIYVRPEIIFRSSANGDIQIEIPAIAKRDIHLNEQWQGHRWKGSERIFMDNAIKEAKWLLYALDQRSETLFKVAQCLARRQRSFLKCGAMGLKPLTLQDVAEEVGLHESTISRVTHGKYANTPLGLIEMRRFFSAGLPTRGGGSISVHRVQQRVKALIESEPACRPVSDQAIADRLQAEGIEIARRTIAKYREALGIPRSNQRKLAIKTSAFQKRRRIYAS